MKFKTALLTLTLLAGLALTGCSTTSVMTPAALQTAVSTGVQVGLDVYPQAAPDVALARDVICAEASSTNVNPATIVNDLSAAGITNSNSKLIVDGALLAYEGVWSLIGTNATTAMEPYLQATCAGLTAGLPPVAAPAAVRRVSAQLLPPHLR
jgi:hypothetical protein